MSIFKFESSNVRDILKYADGSCLAIFDIDHTLIEPVQTIGSTHWERHLMKKLMEKGFTYHESAIRAFHQWRTIQHLTDVKLVEESIFEVITGLKLLQIQTLGLTARDGTLSSLTFDQLKSVNLHNMFSQHKVNSNLMGNFPCTYFNGAVFCGFNKKDEALKLFLEQANFKPKKILFIDDQQSHVDELEELSRILGIEYVGMKYTASGDHTFDPKVAEMQERHLPKLLSDGEALDLLEA